MITLNEKTMLKNISFFLVIFLVLSCSTRNDTYSDIELMSYHWSSYKRPMPYVQCHIYALIDKSGDVKLCTYKVYPDSGIGFFRIKVDRSLIDKVIESSDTFLNDPNMSFKKLSKGMMDEANIKIRINQNTSDKTINFIDNNHISGIYNFMKLFNAIDSVYKSGNYEKLDDTLKLLSRRDEFIKFAMKIDSILAPPVPPPSKEVVKQKIR